MIKELVLVLSSLLLARAAPATNSPKTEVICNDVTITIITSTRLQRGKAEAWYELVKMMIAEPVNYNLSEADVNSLQMTAVIVNDLLDDIAEELSETRPFQVDDEVKRVRKSDINETEMRPLTTKIPMRTRRSLSSPRKESYTTITRDVTPTEKDHSSFKNHQPIRLGGSLSSSRKESYITITAEGEVSETLEDVAAEAGVSKKLEDVAAEAEVSKKPEIVAIQQENQVKVDAPIAHITELSSHSGISTAVAISTVITAAGGAVGIVTSPAGGAVGIVTSAASGAIGNNGLTFASAGTTTGNAGTASTKVSELINKIVKSEIEDLVFEIAFTTVEELIENAAPRSSESQEYEDMSELEAKLNQLEQENKVLEERVDLNSLKVEAVSKAGQILIERLTWMRLAEQQSKNGRVHKEALPVSLWKDMIELYTGPPSWNPELNGLKAELLPHEHSVKIWAPLRCAEESSSIMKSTNGTTSTKHALRNETIKKETIFLVTALTICVICAITVVLLHFCFWMKH
jgi:hypothetical protein